MCSSRSRKRLPSSLADQLVDAVSSSLDRMQHPLAEQREACLAISLPLDEFELGYLPLLDTIPFRYNHPLEDPFGRDYIIPSQSSFLPADSVPQVWP